MLADRGAAPADLLAHFRGTGVIVRFAIDVRTTSPLVFVQWTAPLYELQPMNWIILFIAGLFEVGWAVGLKYTEGFTRLWPTVGTAVAMIISLWLLGIAMKTLPLGTAYAVWVGVGAIGTAILGIFLFHEPINLGRIISLMLILGGIIGLRMSSPV